MSAIAITKITDWYKETSGDGKVTVSSDSVELSASAGANVALLRLPLSVIENTTYTFSIDAAMKNSNTVGRVSGLLYQSTIRQSIPLQHLRE